MLKDINGLRRGIGKLRQGRSFPGYWLRITQLYPGGGNNLLNKAGGAFGFCKLPESTGDKLIAWGDGFQLSLGTRLDTPGEVLSCIGEVTPLDVEIPPENNL